MANFNEIEDEDIFDLDPEGVYAFMEDNNFFYEIDITTLDRTVCIFNKEIKEPVAYLMPYDSYEKQTAKLENK